MISDDRFAAWLAGQEDPEVEAAIARDAGLARTAAWQTALDQGLAAALDEPSGPRLRDRILESVRSPSERVLRRRILAHARPPRRWPLLAAAAALAALVGAALLVLPERGTKDAAASGTATVVADGAPLSVPAEVIAGTAGRRIQWSDGTRIDLRPGAAARVSGSDPATLTLVSGSLSAAVSHQPAGRNVRVTTAEAEVIVVGTRFEVERSADMTAVTVADGRVRVRAQGVERQLEPDGTARVDAGGFTTAADLGAFVRSIPAECWPAMVGSAPDAEGLMPPNQRAWQSAYRQRDGVLRLLRGVATDDARERATGWTVVAATMAHENADGSFGEPWWSAAYWLDDFAWSRLVAATVDPHDPQLHRWDEALRRAAQRLSADAAALNMTAVAPHRLLATSTALRLAGEALADQSWSATARRLLEAALSRELQGGGLDGGGEPDVPFSVLSNLARWSLVDGDPLARGALRRALGREIGSSDEATVAARSIGPHVRTAEVVGGFLEASWSLRDQRARGIALAVARQAAQRP